jgi:hypothetical protein
MSKHPNIIPATILSAGIIISAMLVSTSIHSLTHTIKEKHIPPTLVPSRFKIEVGNESDTPFHVDLKNGRTGTKIAPLVIQQQP